MFLRSGSTGVSLFLVLSGFCLYLPFAGGKIARFRAREFFRRRCTRLMPAYYVALVLALLLAIATAGPLGLPRFSIAEGAWQLVTHALLIHTLFPDTFYSLNGAFWSLGLEWQLYLALPLLVWIVRRVGLTYAVLTAVTCNVVYRLGLGLAINHGLIDANDLLSKSVLPNQLPGRWAEFAFGMVAADLYASGRLARVKHYVPLALAACVALVPISLWASKFDLGHISYGALFFTLLCLTIVSDNPVARVLSWKPLVALGTMSYSLYLVHQPVIQSVAMWLQLVRPDLSPTTVFLALVVLLPAIVFLAWILFMTVERRTMTAHRVARPSHGASEGALAGTVAASGHSPASLARSPVLATTTVPAGAQGSSSVHN